MQISVKFVILNVLQIVSEDENMSKYHNPDEERSFGTFSQVNIYIVDSHVLSRFLGEKTLGDHYNDWLNGDIFSNQYILNVLKNQMQSIEFDNAYYLMKEYGNKYKLKLNQNAFYQMNEKDIELLLISAKIMSETKLKNYVFKQHMQKLERLLDRSENQKLKNKTLLISTW